MYSTVINAITSLFQAYLTSKQNKAQLKQAIHQKQIDEIQQGNDIPPI
ncbi:hypothetical protein [Spartinivicinus ruber]|nr:hypothetical protein [Spartinivicinus ruber]